MITARDRQFVECPFCGSHHAGILGMVQEYIQLEVDVAIECLECHHEYTVGVSLRNEQEHLAAYPCACPAGCPDYETHRAMRQTALFKDLGRG